MGLCPPLFLIGAIVPSPRLAPNPPPRGRQLRNLHPHTCVGGTVYRHVSDREDYFLVPRSLPGQRSASVATN
ncbi:hypothetical protein C0J52_24950 [Blattella germanica]|nr:hypothetical protein C0J52_24950 [Blattella germanica]